MTGNQENEASSATTTARDPWLGCVVGDRYRIEEWIGQGGMGVVYRGRHLELGKRVAIKRLDPRIASDPASFERFRREAIAASHIESPHVVHVFDWGKAADGSPYLVMELLEGCDLRGLFQTEGRLLAEPAATIIGQVLRALIRTHQAQIIHRDLKPENIFLCRYDSDELYVKLLDFGISKQQTEKTQQQTVTRRGVILGTASYMSPEQARGEATLDARSDLYSVGAILFEALSGRVPHQSRTYEGTLVDICTRDADDVRLHAPLVPEALALVVTRALQRDVTRRFQTAKEFLAALTAAVPDIGRRLSENPTGPTSTATDGVPPGDALERHRPKAKQVVAVALLLGAGALLWFMTKTQGASPPNAMTAPTSSNAVARERATPSAVATTSLPLAPDSTILTGSASPRASNSSPLGASSGRAFSHHPGATPNPPPAGPGDNSGVASGLKLRRTMP